MDVNNQRKPLLYYWLIALLIMGVINMFFLPFMTKNTIEQVNYDVFLTQMQNKNISQAEVNEDVIYFYLKDEDKSDKAGTTIFSENTQKVYSTVRMDDPQLVERLYNAGASFGEVKPKEVSPWFSTLIMFVVFFLLWQFVMKKAMSKMGGIGNDADNMRLLLKDSKSKQALVTQLRINALVQEGMRPKDMPAEWFSQTEDINYKDALQVTIALMSASRLLDCEKWEAAYNAFEKIMSHRHEVIGLLIKENACELLFTALVTKRTARAEELYTDELDTYIRQYKDVTSSKQRLLCALALYRDKDTAKAKGIYEATCQRKNKYLMQGEVHSDIALMKSILTAKNAL